MNTFSEYQNIIEKALNRNEIHKNLNESITFSGLAGPVATQKYTMSDYIGKTGQIDHHFPV